MAAENFNENKLTIGSLTGGEKEGRGIFDELMRSVKSHLEGEYNAKRITGAEYTQAYIASMQAAMAQGSQYLLSYITTNQQIRLLDQQILEAEKNVELVQAQIDQIRAQILLNNEQIILAQKQQLQADQDLANSVKQGSLLDEQIKIAAQDVLIRGSQKTKIDEDTKLVTQQTTNAATQNTVLTNQAAKLVTEKNVLEQKLITEQAQTQDQISGADVGGVIGKQMVLYTNQADGYIRDAEQKAAKFYTDNFATRVSVDFPTTDATNAGLADPEVKTVLNKLRQGIGISPLSL